MIYSHNTSYDIYILAGDLIPIMMSAESPISVTT